VSAVFGECVSLHLTGCSSSLWVSLFLSYGGPYLGAAFLKLLQDSLAFLQPQLLRWLLAYISNYQSTKGAAHLLVGPSPLEGYAVAIIMFVASMIQTVILHQVTFSVNMINILC
jgi:ATP-binding cassette subfamily C (CFTR/MRP) protein 1